MVNVLVVGSGGREHALVWKLNQSQDVDRVFCAPGNGGIDQEAKTIDIKVGEFEKLAEFSEKKHIDLTVVGPEAPLVDGIVDYFQERGLRIFRPSKEAAQLEGSKAFAKEFMEKYGIPTADFEVFSQANHAKDYVKDKGMPVVVKADGLAAGKGSIVCKTLDEAVNAIDKIMVKKEFGDSGNMVVIEDFMEGEEASILALTDGKTVLPLISSQDHKPIYEGDKGPNTGGMGAYAPAPVVTSEVMQKVYDKILIPTVENMAKEKSSFIGCLYVGLIIKYNEPKVVEFNIRFGDPEAQPVLSLLDNDLYELLNACIDCNLNKYKIKNKKDAACCVVMASGGYPESYEKEKEIFGLDKVKDRKDIYVFHAGTKIKDGKVLTNGGRVLGVMGLGSTIENAINNAYSGVSKIFWENEYHRKDIGVKAFKR